MVFNFGRRVRSAPEEEEAEEEEAMMDNSSSISFSKALPSSRKYIFA
jgi:hypothetical protein